MTILQILIKFDLVYEIYCKFKGSPDRSSFIFESNLGKSRNPTYSDSEMERRISRSAQNRLKMASFYFRVVLCRIRIFPTLILMIKWLWSGLPLKWVVQYHKQCFAQQIHACSPLTWITWRLNNTNSLRFIARSKFIISVSSLTIFFTWWSSLKTITLFILSLNLFGAVSYYVWSHGVSVQDKFLANESWTILYQQDQNLHDLPKIYQEGSLKSSRLFKWFQRDSNLEISKNQTRSYLIFFISWPD